ncbi:MAG: GNAT family N-acetyltransferase [Cyanobacteriota bacterium]
MSLLNTCEPPSLGFFFNEVDYSHVGAFDTWSLAIAALRERLRRGTGRDPQPIALLARLGVDQRHEGKGLGAALLLDVITRVASLNEASLSEAIGCRGLLVHAESVQARSFYEHLIPEFERSPTDPLHLLLLLKDIRRTLRR